jgi:hypothetical protein
MNNLKNSKSKVSIVSKNDQQKAIEIRDSIAAFYHFILMLLNAIIILNNPLFRVLNIFSFTLFLISFFYLLLRNNPFQVYVIYATIVCVIIVIVGIFDPYRYYYTIPLPASEIFLIYFTGFSQLPWAIYIILTLKFSGTSNIAKHVFFSSYGPQGYGKKRLERFWQMNPERDPEYKQKIIQVRKQYHKRLILLLVMFNTIFFITTYFMDYLVL